jgi:hypothetical protein
MIISASYKTDIPAFYGDWLMNRLRAGYCKMVNPYSKTAYRISLRQADVDGIVFWTKNLGPFLRRLPEIRAMGYPFMVQYTINGYPRTLEFSVVQAQRSVDHMKFLTHEFGQRVAVWRYDPILLTSETPADFHRRNFEKLAHQLEGVTTEVVLSFAQIYRKTKRNMDWAASEFGFQWNDPSEQDKVLLLSDLRDIAKSFGIQVAMCSQPQFLTTGITEAHCVDAVRLSEIAGKPLRAELRGNRPGCGCYSSRDIGEYDTCPHGCVYCYAVQNRNLAQTRYRQHDPQGEFLFPPSGNIIETATETEPKPDNQMRFDFGT